MNNYDIRILQINLNRSQYATESTLQYAVENNIGLILVQEPWLINSQNNDYSSTRSISHQGFTQIKPNSPVLVRPRTWAYIAKNSLFDISISDISPNDPDLLILNINNYQIINIYNQLDQGGSRLKTLDRVLYPLFETKTLSPNSVILGDFNLYHIWWDPHISRESHGASDLVEWVENHNLSLLNKSGGTFYRPNLTRESTIDLTFTSTNLVNKITDWAIIPNLGSDHYGITFTISNKRPIWVENPIQSIGFNLKLANWELFTKTIQLEYKQCLILNSDEFKRFTLNPVDILVNQHQEIELLDSASKEFTDLVIKSAESSIPKIKSKISPKPWWNEDLKSRRKIMIRQQKSLLRNNNPYNKGLYLQARNSYFQAIKSAKRDHWNTFLENNDPKSIFKAFSYTSDKLVEKIPNIKSTETDELFSTFEDKCITFRNTLFPPPPSTDFPNWDNFKSENWKWPSLSETELKEACIGKIKGTTPGPDLITQEIISRAYMAIPDPIYQLYSKLINTGYHPIIWRQATGAILKKPNKPDYTIPKAYRVISLLNCLGKVSERILAKRLGYLAETTSLLHQSQIGDRLKKSAIDAALLLNNEIELNKQLKLKSSVLLVDIRGAFDHVAKNQLLTILKELGLPLSLISWIYMFLSKRLLRLSFDGKIEQFSDIITGIPQGSPISPILFLIYIRNLFKSSLVRFISYMDDIALVASSKSYNRNCKILEREIGQITEIGQQNAIKFDLAKTELIHFGTKNIKSTLKLPDGSIIQPTDLVKWLGIWFDSNLTYKYHVAQKVTKARSNLHRILRIVNINRGLTPTATRQLYLACIVSIADYGSIIWWKGQKSLIKPLQAIQNTACLRILGVFKTAPILAREVESALLPPQIRLNHNIRQYAFRLAKLSKKHPINLEWDNNRLLEQQNNRPFKSTLQLDRIVDSISQFIDTDIEEIRPFHFAPWEKSTPYSVNISKSDKDKATSEHIKLINSTNAPNIYNIYSDASQMPKSISQGIGIGLAVLRQNRLIHRKMINIGHSQIVYNGELQGVIHTINYTNSVTK